MKNLILYFFLLIFKILFNFILNIIYKYDRFSKTLLKKILNLSQVKGIALLFFSNILFFCYQKLILLHKKKIVKYIYLRLVMLIISK